jgi:aerotaxis receptor
MAVVRRDVTNVETQVPGDAFIYSQTDLKGMIVEANDVFANLSGYEAEEMVGRPHNLVRHPDMPKEAFADMWRSLKAGRPWQGAVKNCRKDGGFYWVMATISPVRGSGGRVVGYQSVRRRPSREQVKAAEDAYKKIQNGDKSLVIEDGRVVKVRSQLAEWNSRPDIQILRAAMCSLAGAAGGVALEMWGNGSGLVRWGAALTFALSALCSLCLLLRTLPNLRRDLGQMEAYLDGILSSGDLTLSFDLEKQDRSGNISRKLKLLIGWVQSSILCIEDAVVPVQTGTQQVLKSILEIDESANSQNLATASVAAASNELELTIREVSEHLRETESAVSETGRRATEGAEVSQSASNRIQELAKSIKGAAVEVEALGTSSAEVGAIAGVIREIADQTNLLALNASIEAARAGDAGRGFAVVANEVRSLADRTMKATAKIDALIGTIKGDGDRAMSGMRTGAAQVTDGVALVQEAQGALSGINDLMAEAVRKVSEIASSSTQQTDAMNEISSNISHVAAMTEQNVLVVHRTKELMGTMAPLVDRVKQAVKQYRV